GGRDGGGEVGGGGGRGDDLCGVAIKQDRRALGLHRPVVIGLGEHGCDDVHGKRERRAPVLVAVVQTATVYVAKDPVAVGIDLVAAGGRRTGGEAGVWLAWGGGSISARRPVG